MTPVLEPLADAVVRRQADQDIPGYYRELDRLIAAVKQVPIQQRHKQANRETRQVALALIREARARHGQV